MIEVLDPADQLLQICAHAAQPAAGAAAEQWPADAALVIRGSADLCFDRLVGESSQRGLSAIMAEAMTFLADEIELPIPRTFISRLRAAADWTERREMRLLAEGSPRGRPSHLLLAFQDFRRSRREVFWQTDCSRPTRLPQGVDRGRKNWSCLAYRGARRCWKSTMAPANVRARLLPSHATARSSG